MEKTRGCNPLLRCRSGRSVRWSTYRKINDVCAVTYGTNTVSGVNFVSNEHHPGSYAAGIADRRDSHPDRAAAAQLYRRPLFDRHRSDRTFRGRQLSLLMTRRTYIPIADFRKPERSVRWQT